METNDRQDERVAHAVGRASEQRLIDVSVVVPSYNPGSSIRTTVDGLVEALRGIGLQFEVIPVSDGSTDGSEQLFLGQREEHVSSIHYPSNAGKGQAIRTGFGQARGQLLAFIDADGDIPPAQIVGAIQTAQLKSADVVLASKLHPDSTHSKGLVRRLYSRLWQLLVSGLFHLHVHDTQTGLKVIRREVVDQCLPLTSERGFAFDLEFLVVARHLGFGHFVEVPVEIIDSHRSTISAKSAVNMFHQALAIYVRCYFLGRYDPKG